MLPICSCSFPPFEHMNVMSKPPIFFLDLKLANLSFNTLKLWIVSFQKCVTLPAKYYTGLLKDNSISTFFQHYYVYLPHYFCPQG